MRKMVGKLEGEHWTKGKLNSDVEYLLLSSCASLVSFLPC